MRDFFLQVAMFGLILTAIGFIGFLVVCHIDHVHCRLRILEETRPIRE